jgi:hypothetical protein
VRSEGLCQRKNLKTPSRIEPATFRFGAQNLNHCATAVPKHCLFPFKPLNAKLNPICHLLPLLGAHHILHVSRIKVKHCLYHSQFITSSVPLPCLSCSADSNSTKMLALMHSKMTATRSRLATSACTYVCLPF